MKVLLVGMALAALAWAQDTRVVLLGTGTPNPEPEHSGPGAAVVCGERVYIVDSGPGIVRRAAQAGIAMRQMTRAFITHLHSDHTAGLPDLILTPAVTGRASALEIYGPPGIREMTANIMRAYREDIDVRLHGLEPAVAQAYVVHAYDVKPGEIYRDEAVKVTAFAVPHGNWNHAYGYRFDAGGKSIVFSGDTSPSDAVVRACNGCDLLIHEVYSAAGLEKRTPEWQRYHRASHTSAVELGKLAAAARPKKLVLSHLLPMGESEEELLGEVRRNFGGEVIYGKDLEVIVP